MKRPWMAMYWGDFFCNTKHLSDAEGWAYVHLMGHYWEHGCLPDDDRKLALITHRTPYKWRQIKSTLQALFHDGWKHKRLDRELAKAADISEKRAIVGKKSHENSSVHKEKSEQNQYDQPAIAHTTTTTVTSDSKEVSSPALADVLIKTDTSVERDGQNGKMVLSNGTGVLSTVLTRAGEDKPSSKNASKRKKADDGWPADYRERFWQTYPHKVGKKVAIHKLDRVRIEGVAFDTLMAGLAGYIRSKPVDRPWCNPLTWLNQGRWDDQPAPCVHIVKPQMSYAERQQTETREIMDACDREIERLRTARENHGGDEDHYGNGPMSVRH